MKFSRPLKEFQLTKNLGALLFYTAVVSGSLLGNSKAFALETPIMPPSVMMASSAKVDNSAKTEIKTVKPVKTVEKKEAKIESQKEDFSKAKISNDKDIGNKLSEEKKIKTNSVSDANDSEKLNNLKEKNNAEPVAITPVAVEDSMPPEIKIDSASDDDFSISGGNEKSSDILIASAKIVEKESSPKTAKVSSKTETKNSISNANVSENKTKNNIVKPIEKSLPEIKINPKKDFSNSKNTSNKEVKKTEDISVSKVKKVKKVVRVENECPPEWDWFSAPLVFVRDANGKLVIMADKNAPKIVISHKKSNSDNEKNIKNVRPQKSFITVKSNSDRTKKIVVKEEVKKVDAQEFVEAKPIEAPAISVNTIEAKPVIEESKSSEVLVANTQNNSDNEPIVLIKSNKADDNSKPMFAEALKKMARIKRLRALDENSNSKVDVIRRRSASMVQLNHFVGELIRKADKKDEAKNVVIKTSITPQAPPQAKKVNTTASSTKTTTTTTASSSNNNSLNGSRIAFRPYINPIASSFGSNLHFRTW